MRRARDARSPAGLAGTAAGSAADSRSSMGALAVARSIGGLAYRAAGLALLFAAAMLWRLSDHVIRFRTVSLEARRADDPSLDPVALGLGFEEITFEARERRDPGSGGTLTLRGWFFPGAAPGAPAVIAVHGMGDNRVGVLPEVVMLVRAGYAVFAFDLRYHGRSGGRFCTWGYFERHDVSAAIDELARRGKIDADRVGVIGGSLGAAIAIQAATVEPRIRAVVADSAYADFRALLLVHGARRYPAFRLLPARAREALADAVLAVAGLRAGFDPRDVAPLKAIRRVGVPTLVLHCADDAEIDAADARHLFEASPAEAKELHVLVDCGHTKGHEAYRDAYEALVLDFLGRHLGRPDPPTGAAPAAPAAPASRPSRG